MRQIKTYEHPSMSITLFEWNNKYILKYETPFGEQTYKVSKLDLAEGQQAMDQLVDSPLTEQALERFKQMRDDWQAALQPYL